MAEKNSRPGAEGMFSLLNEYPSLLPSAPPDARAGDAAERAATGRQYCMHCGKVATVAFLAVHHKAGKKWMDLCPECRDWVREALARAQARSDAGKPPIWEDGGSA